MCSSEPVLLAKSVADEEASSASLEPSLAMRILAGKTIGSSRTTITGQWACLTTESETLPIKALLIPPRPRLPITMRPAPSSSANATISSDAPPTLRCARATSSPAASSRPTASSRVLRASRAMRAGSSSMVENNMGIKGPTWTTCSSESVPLARSTAVVAASSASLEPSVARSILVGKMLIVYASSLGALSLCPYDDSRRRIAHRPLIIKYAPHEVRCPLSFSGNLLLWVALLRALWHTPLGQHFVRTTAHLRRVREGTCRPLRGKPFAPHVERRAELPRTSTGEVRRGLLPRTRLT